MPKISLPAQHLEKLGDNTTIQAVYRAPSKSRPGTWHHTIIYNDGRGIKCDCEGFMFRGRCWHTQDIPLCVADEPVTPGRYVAQRSCSFFKDHPGKHSWDYGKK